MNKNFKSTFVLRLNKYKYLFIIPLVILAIWITSSFIYKKIINNKANKISLLFSEIQENLIQKKVEYAQELLTKMEQEGTEGYKLISYLQQASLSMNNKEFPKAIEILNKVNNLNIPQYYKDLTNYIISAIQLDHEKDLKILITKIEKTVIPTNAFYTANLEILSIAQYLTKDYDSSLLNLEKIINDNKTPKGLKERAKSLKSLVTAYVK